MKNENVGSIRRWFLYASLVASTAGNFAAAGDEKTATPSSSRAERVLFDSASGRAWVLTTDGVVLYQKGTQAKTLIRLADWLWAGGRSCLPDLALGPAGEMIVTSNIVPVLWRIDPKTLAVTTHALVLDTDTDKDVGFTAIAYSPEHSAFFAFSGIQRSLWRIDATLSKADKVLSSADKKGILPCAIN